VNGPRAVALGSQAAILRDARAKSVGMVRDARLGGRAPTRYILPIFALIAALHSPSPAPAAEADLVEQGRDLYGDICATCHGRDMVNAGTISFDLRKFPKDDLARFRNSVLNGKNQAMPAWRDKITDEDLTALWAYVRSGG
jgi:mono/diheme cytochrome c family protein